MACCAVRMLRVRERDYIAQISVLDDTVAGVPFTHFNGTNRKRGEKEDNEGKVKLKRKLDCWCKLRLLQKRNLQGSTGLTAE